MKLDSICDLKGCGAKATHAVALNIPAKDCHIAEHEPIRCIAGLQVCEACFATLTVAAIASFTGANGITLPEIVSKMCKARNLAAPDFSRAWLDKVTLDSEEWRTFNDARHGNQ